MEWYWIVLLVFHFLVMIIAFRIVVINIGSIWSVYKKSFHWYDAVVVYTAPLFWEIWWVILIIRSKNKKKKVQTNE